VQDAAQLAPQRQRFPDSTGSLLRRIQADDTERGDQDRCSGERAWPGEQVAQNQGGAGGQDTHAREPDAHPVGDAEFLSLEQLDCVAINGDVVGGGEEGEQCDGNPHRRPEAGLGRQEQQAAAHRKIDTKHPATMVTIMVNGRGPQELDRPRQAQ